MPDASVDSIVTDPPYDLNFMGKAWDSTGVAFRAETWKEALRVLKPGGHLVAFGGTRTYHRLACAIEDAGFEIRDSLHWCQGQGFPKSLDVSKAIDDKLGMDRQIVAFDASRVRQNRKYEAGAIGNLGGTGNVSDRSDNGATITAPASEEAKKWKGFGTALKPAHEPVVLARKPFIGTVADNVIVNGTGALNIDGCRVKANETLVRPPIERDDNTAYGHGLGVGVQQEPIGRFPPNLLLGHAPGCRCVGTKTVKPKEGYRPNPVSVQSDGSIKFNEKQVGYQKTSYTDDDGTEEVSAWEHSPGCPVAAMDAQSGSLKSGVMTGNQQGWGKHGIYGESGLTPATCYADNGGASRFFPTFSFDPDYDVPFLYCGKASRGEREEARPDDYPKDKIWNVHTTVKPVALMRWLCRLVTPPGGTILEPFGGSGTTLVAAIKEGFDVVGIEMTDEYLPIIRSRADKAMADMHEETKQQTLFG